MVDRRKLSKMKLEELERDLALYLDEIELRRAGVAPSYKKPGKSIRVGPRDKRVMEHLKVARALTTRQVARLEYLLSEADTSSVASAEPFSVAYAQKRLYQLATAGFVESVPSVLKPVPGLPGTNTAWVLTARGLDYLVRPGDEDERPKPLLGRTLGHLVAVNEVYVLIHELLREVPGYDPRCWRWVAEPACHRPYGGTPGSPAGRQFGQRGGNLLKPDAEIVLFDDTVVFLERQTEQAQEKPGKIHDRMFEYHAYENSLERRADRRKMSLLWACDVERDGRAVRQAEKNHPTRHSREFGMGERSEKRMPVGTGSPLWVAGHVRDYVARRLGREAS